MARVKKEKDDTEEEEAKPESESSSVQGKKKPQRKAPQRRRGTRKRGRTSYAEDSDDNSVSLQQQHDDDKEESLDAKPPGRKRKVPGRKRKAVRQEKSPSRKKKTKTESPKEEPDDKSITSQQQDGDPHEEESDAKPPARKTRAIKQETSSPRKKKKKIKTETPPPPPARRIRRTRSQSRQQEQEQKKEDGCSGPDKDGDAEMGANSGGEAEDSHKANRTSNKGRPPTEGKQSAKCRGPVEQRTCPHCNLIMSSKLGLKYHVDNYVCRIEECKDPHILDKATRRRGKGKKGKSSGGDGIRARGTLEQRTCPDCKRVFTSSLGATYHKKHRVCQPTKNEGKTFPFHQLQPGERFVTKFGIVEVVKDERATPTAELPPNMKNAVRLWSSSKSNVEALATKWTNFKCMHLRCRRQRINDIYQSGGALQKDKVFKAYFGGDPRFCEHKKIPLIRKAKPDPLAPKDSYPDRIVECIMVPDTRQRFSSNDLSKKVPTGTQTEAFKNPTRLFLRRDALTDPWTEENPTYLCADCGRHFLSVTGLKYHGSGKVCAKAKKAAGEARDERIKTVAEGARRIEKGHIIPEYPSPPQPPPPPRPRHQDRSKDGMKNKRPPKKKELGIYPEVLLCLGFQFVKEDLKFTEDMNLPPPVQMETEEEEVELQDNLLLDPPVALLASLKKRLETHQRVADDQKYGAMYQGVFVSLGFKKARKKRAAASSAGGSRRRRQKKEKPPPPPKPLPPIIDTLALAAEVNSGRYPSLKRYEDDDHDDKCALCKDGGHLICCDFCKNAEHLECVRKRYTVKDPEPKDDFMCHKCIQTVLARRARAEKRRREKLERDFLRNEQMAQEEREKTSNIEVGKEYEYMAGKGKEVSELVELLQDAQNRLQQCLATTTMNNARRRIMGCERGA